MCLLSCGSNNLPYFELNSSNSRLIRSRRCLSVAKVADYWSCATSNLLDSWFLRFQPGMGRYRLMQAKDKVDTTE